MSEIHCEKFVDQEGYVYAHSRAEAFFLDQVAHLLNDYGKIEALTDADKEQLSEWIGWLKHYAESLQHIIRKLPDEDQNAAFDKLFMFMSASFGVGAIGTGASESAIRLLQNSQSALARAAKKPDDEQKARLLKKAVKTAIKKLGRVPAISENYARDIRDEVLGALPRRLTENGWPKEGTIKNMVRKVKDEANS